MPKNIREFLVGRKKGENPIPGVLSSIQETKNKVFELLSIQSTKSEIMKIIDFITEERKKYTTLYHPGRPSIIPLAFLRRALYLLKKSKHHKDLVEVFKKIKRSLRTLIKKINNYVKDCEVEERRKSADLNEVFYEATCIVKRDKTLRKLLAEQATSIRRMFRPSIVYLQTVLDHELAKKNRGTLDVAELAASAAAIASVNKQWGPHQELLDEAAILIRDHIGKEGIFPTSSYLTTLRDGTHTAAIVGSEVIRAYAQLLQSREIKVAPDTVRAMMRYFTVTAVDNKFEDMEDINTKELLSAKPSIPCAWANDHPRTPKKAFRWTSSLTLLALDSIGWMLDERINKRIYCHFSVRKPEEMADGLALNKLIYPDYGMASITDTNLKDFLPKEARNESLAYYLERARGHLFGEPRLKGRYFQRCFSLLLYGPPGTGKTTFMEALASSSNCPLIEVTPSDIVIEGEALLEHRSRVVFEALSMLTRTVILFDEFDPILRSRVLDQGQRPSVFSFVTPGMLPKLKNLNQKAKQQQLVYALNTNRIGVLDEAAIRSGRFDFKIGVFPPDFVSRAGAIVRQIRDACKKGFDTKEISKVIPIRTAEIVASSAGMGMTAFAADGNLRAIPKENGKSNAIHKSFPAGTMMQVVFQNNTGRDKFEPGPPDANPNLPRDGQGEYYQYESNQWAWILEADKRAELVVEHSDKIPKQAT